MGTKGIMPVATSGAGGPRLERRWAPTCATPGMRRHLGADNPPTCAYCCTLHIRQINMCEFAPRLESRRANENKGSDEKLLAPSKLAAGACSSEVKHEEWGE